MPTQTWGQLPSSHYVGGYNLTERPDNPFAGLLGDWASGYYQMPAGGRPAPQIDWTQSPRYNAIQDLARAPMPQTSPLDMYQQTRQKIEQLPAPGGYSTAPAPGTTPDATTQPVNPSYWGYNDYGQPYFSGEGNMAGVAGPDMGMGLLDMGSIGYALGTGPTGILGLLLQDVFNYGSNPFLGIDYNAIDAFGTEGDSGWGGIGDDAMGGGYGDLDGSDSLGGDDGNAYA